MSKARELAELGAVYDSGALSNRNLVINGNMQVAQRGSFTISTTGSPEYGGPARFHVWTYTSTEQVVADVSQDTDVPSGLGFSNSYKFDVTTAESAVASDEALLIGHYIEAQNLQHLEYGTSSAKNLTLSFHIKSTKTGTYCLSVTAPDGSRNIIKEYTVSASDTWEKKTILIPGDTSGAINNDNGQGLWLQWVLMAGTDRHKAADSWSGTTSDIATSNQVNALDSTSNNIYLAGVQLEVGTEATPFEHRNYADELVRCQRYYEKIARGASNSTIIGGGMWYNSSSPYVGCKFKVTKRATPAVSNGTSSNGYTWFCGGSSRTSSAITFSRQTTYSVRCSQSGGLSGSGGTSPSGTHACWFELQGTGASIDVDAEL